MQALHKDVCNCPITAYKPVLLFVQALHEDVYGHQQPVRSLVYQSEQLVEHHQEELTPEQVAELQNLEAVIKTAYGKVGEGGG